MSANVVRSIESKVRTNLAAAARHTDAIVADVSRVHDAALGPFGDSTCCNLNLLMSTAVVVENLGAVKHGFGSNAVGL